MDSSIIEPNRSATLTPDAQRQSRRTVLMGCPVDLLTSTALLNELSQAIDSQSGPKVIQFINANKIAQVRQDSDMGRIMWKADYVLADGQPLLGRSKTVRGVLLGIVVTAATAPLLGLPWTVGALAGAAAMAGDLVSSFVKRRLRRPPSSMARGLDQIPESLLPLLACKSALGLSAPDIVVGTAAFWLGELVLSRALFALRIRDQPY